MTDARGMNYLEPRKDPYRDFRPKGYSGPVKIYRIDDGETHWVAATGSKVALRYHGVDSLGYESVAAYKRDLGPVSIFRLFPHEWLKVTYDCGKVVGMRARDWAADQLGVFCSTVW